MSSLARGGVRVATVYSEQEVRRSVSDMGMGLWVSSLLEKTLVDLRFADTDFMGQRNGVVSLSDLLHALAYFATTVGYADHSPTVDDFRRRPRVYRSMLKKVENWSTLTGSQKITSAKKYIRVQVNAKTAQMTEAPNPLGVFVQDAKDVEPLYRETDLKNVVAGLHRLGRFPESNPRFYVHMVFRYYMGELHRQLADEGKVLRFPSIQKVLDIRFPVGCVACVPPEFRMFLQNARGAAVPAVSLPVPSKSTPNQVLYDYDFESSVPWVPVMRARIFDIFVVELSPLKSPLRYREIYPRCLVKGEAGCKEGNAVVLDALARTIEVDELRQTLAGGCRAVDSETANLLDKVLSADPRVACISPRYNRHIFQTEGEQLRERLGFLLQDSVRGVFRSIASKVPSFCNDLYASLGISYVTMDVFAEYCTDRTSMRYNRRDEQVWRNFVLHVHRIITVLHAWSRKEEVDRFVQRHGSTDGYLAQVLRTVL